MGNFLKRGNRIEKRKADKNSKKVIKEFKIKIDAMNTVVNSLMKDPNLTIDNYPDKVKEITNVTFTEKQHSLIKGKLPNLNEGDVSH